MVLLANIVEEPILHTVARCAFFTLGIIAIKKLFAKLKIEISATEFGPYLWEAIRLLLSVGDETIAQIISQRAIKEGVSRVLNEFDHFRDSL